MQFLKPYLSSFEQYLATNRFNLEPKSLYEPLDYLLGLGGKRVRPCLALLSFDLYKDDIEKVLPIAMAVELFHNFSLMHDDIMDDADLRRGGQTVHVKYDENSAILSGDLMLIKACQYLEKLDVEIYKPIMHVFNKMAVGVCEGQRLDMDFETRNDVLISEYIEMITNKTSVLLAASLQMGAICAEADEMDQYHIYEFGKNIGIAFQIQDDILDLYGDEQVGKKIGGDVIQNKKTYLLLKAIELSDDKTYQKLIETLQIEDEDRKVIEVRKMFDQLVVKEYASQVMEAYRDLAVSHIHQLKISEENKVGLISFADYLIQRKF